MLFVDYEGSGAGYFEILEQQFGKYPPTLLKDLELDKSEMKQVITFMQTDVNTARSIFMMVWKMVQRLKKVRLKQDLINADLKFECRNNNRV